MPGVILDKVNPEQQAAIHHGQGPLLIVAGASGICYLEWLELL